VPYARHQEVSVKVCKGLLLDSDLALRSEGLKHGPFVLGRLLQDILIQELNNIFILVRVELFIIQLFESFYVLSVIYKPNDLVRVLLEFKDALFE
jgi:hypothetical protein